ncbi:uncharacterized protein TNCV_2889181 [Trichonephila clavipes]|nr:uncharacterized protein TNCV_2889181 [Trichonephila clavipes]
MAHVHTSPSHLIIIWLLKRATPERVSLLTHRCKPRNLPPVNKDKEIVIKDSESCGQIETPPTMGLKLKDKATPCPAHTCSTLVIGQHVAAVAEWYRYRTVACFVTGSIPVPLKTRRVGQRCMLNLSRAETSSRWCGVVVRREGGASSGVVHVTRPWFKITWSVAKSPRVAEQCDVNIQSIHPS